MMEGYFEIGWTDVIISLSLIVVVLVVAVVQRLGIAKSVLIGAVRTFAQLMLIGYVLKFVFDLSKWYWVVLMLAVMLVVASRTAAARDECPCPGKLLLSGTAITAGVIITMLTVIGFVIRLRPWYTPHILIPITGMVIGNTMNAVALTISRFRGEVRSARQEVETALALGATPAEACVRQRRQAVRAALIPTINALMVVGLVQLPGMMSGQIIAGVLSVEAVRYQIVIMYMVASGAAVGSFVAVQLLRRQLFTRRQQLRADYL
ncbi:MAG: iron export ABC transporter permease subunit FetB [Candidatus Eisenbacteria bacterium]|nr:iron export ABC transporter permease subunit FetB [Candidatus Eisenbacteria bacterium]